MFRIVTGTCVQVKIIIALSLILLSNELFEKLGKALGLSRDNCVFVVEQTDLRGFGSYLKQLSFQKFSLGVRQTSHLLIVSDALGQMSLSQLQSLQLKKKIRNKGTDRNRRAMSSGKKRKSYTSYSLVSFLHSKTAKSLQQHYSIGNRRE